MKRVDYVMMDKDLVDKYNVKDQYELMRDHCPHKHIVRLRKEVNQSRVDEMGLDKIPIDEMDIDDWCPEVSPGATHCFNCWHKQV